MSRILTLATERPSVWRADADADAVTPADTQVPHCAFAGGQFRLVARDGLPWSPRPVSSRPRLA